LAGLNADYVYKQLQAFRTPLRPHGVLMKNETRSLNEAQLRAVATYVQSR
jgi:cytochrome c553